MNKNHIFIGLLLSAILHLFLLNAFQPAEKIMKQETLEENKKAPVAVLLPDILKKTVEAKNLLCERKLSEEQVEASPSTSKQDIQLKELFILLKTFQVL